MTVVWSHDIGDAMRLTRCDPYVNKASRSNCATRALDDQRLLAIEGSQKSRDSRPDGRSQNKGAKSAEKPSATPYEEHIENVQISGANGSGTSST